MKKIILLAVVALLGAGVVAWADVTTSDQAVTVTVSLADYDLNSFYVPDFLRDTRTSYMCPFTGNPDTCGYQCPCTRNFDCVIYFDKPSDWYCTNPGPPNCDGVCVPPDGGPAP